ncbi:MAG TPA: hypothetical protein VF215_02165 [Thermoanaerobaculia bacterium]
MSEDIRDRNVVYTLPEMERVSVRHEETFDLYRPATAARIPAVVLVAGYPDPGFQRIVGCKFKDMGSSTSWARLIAASGMAAITYTNLDPARDLDLLLDRLREPHVAAELGIDEHRLGLWASSGNAPLALAASMDPRRTWLRCVALCYGYTLDLDGSTAAADASRSFGFVNATAGRTMDDVRTDVPLFVARAGRDPMPHLNETLDRFTFEAIRRNVPLTFANHPNGPHAFDLFDDSDASRTIVRQILLFLRAHLIP